jgi:VIT1/CCC1 family predicted Fe2+/Mn2+ transporter
VQYVIARSLSQQGCGESWEVSHNPLGRSTTFRRYQAPKRRLLEGAKRLRPAPARVERQDIYTALACFIVVFSCTLPVAVPFMLLHDKAMALRLSNLIGLVALFICGYKWGGLAGANRFWTGTVMLLLGGVLVAITVVLGG